MKTILLILFEVYALITGILYFRMHNKQSNLMTINFEWFIAQTIKFIVFMFWGWLLYPIALIKQKIVKKDIEDSNQKNIK